MKEQLTITTERVDDIALLLAHTQRMGLDSLLDKHFPTHGRGIWMVLLVRIAEKGVSGKHYSKAKLWE